MGTIITAVVLICIVGLVIRRMIRDKKNGKSIQCGGNCAGCPGACGRVQGQEQEQKKG